MNINGLGVWLTEPKGILPNGDMVCYTDIEGARINIPLTVIVRLYDLAKFDMERRGTNFDEYVDRLMKAVK